MILNLVLWNIETVFSGTQLEELKECYGMVKIALFMKVKLYK